MTTTYKPESDVIIVGAGAAGLFAALTLAPRKVTVLSEKPLGGICASCWAQGGIAAAVGKDDNVKKHAADTMKAAAGTADRDVVDLLTAEAPKYVEILEKLGVQFERDTEGSFKLSREACHSDRRVLKALAGDGFGAELMRALVEAVKHTPSITFVESVSAERILRADGVTSGEIVGILARSVDTGAPHIFLAPAVIMATGGVGGLYAYTTNPLGAIGRGVALAARAGAVLSDLEFVQFHPTALDIGEDPCPLATEALRGEGAKLINSRGEQFMLKYHKMGDLAPRDIVSRGIFAEIQRGQKVYLDCRAVDVSHFPALLSAAKRAGLDPARDLIPVQPAVHYHMGGISTNLTGRTSVLGLWACGEVAATGLHGANRLASNSLMEAVVMAGRAAGDIDAFLKSLRTIPHHAFSVPMLSTSAQMEAARDTVRHIMSDLVGVIRDSDSLKKAISQIHAVETAAVGVDTKTADMALVARMIAVAAYMRKESRGGHSRSDYPIEREEWQHRSFTTLKEMNLLTDKILAHARKVEAVA